MKKLLVSLDIITDLTLSELSARLGRNPSQQYSHEKGEARGINDVFTETVWRLDSRIPATATLEEHLDNLAAQCPPAELLRSGTLPKVLGCMWMSLYFSIQRMLAFQSLRSVSIL